MEKISDVQLIADNDVMFTEEDEQTDTEVTEMEVETENRRGYSQVDQESKSIHEGIASVYTGSSRKCQQDGIRVWR
jgi:nucleosome binding factor SPN SPT16 subunit